MKNIKTLNRQAGLTILELLVAMTLGVVVLGAAVSMQVSYQKGFQATDNKLNMQTNARFAFEFISNSLREAGSAGCLTANGYVARTKAMQKFLGTDMSIYRESPNYQIAFVDPTSDVADFRFQQELIGFNDGSTEIAPTALVPASNAGSDVLLVKGAIGASYIFKSSTVYDSNHLSLQLDTNRYPLIDLKTNQYAVMSQCSGAEIFKITSTSAEIAAGKILRAAATTPVDSNLNGTFATDGRGLSFSEGGESAELRRMATVAYYISNNPSGVPTLFRSVDGVPSALVEGVERMQILYGLDTDNDKVPDTYQDAAAAKALSANNDLADAVAVRLSFIVRSQQQVYENAVSQTLTIPGESNYVVTDRFSRQVFTSTVTLRNRYTGDRVGTRI